MTQHMYDIITREHDSRRVAGYMVLASARGVEQLRAALADRLGGDFSKDDPAVIYATATGTLAEIVLTLARMWEAERDRADRAEAELKHCHG